MTLIRSVWEDRLDDGLVGMIRPKTDSPLEPDEDVEFQQVQAAVLRECILNLARIKGEPLPW